MAGLAAEKGGGKGGGHGGEEAIRTAVLRHIDANRCDARGGLLLAPFGSDEVTETMKLVDVVWDGRELTAADRRRRVHEP